MSDTMMLQLAAKGVAPGTGAGMNPLQGDQGNAPASGSGGFGGILRAILSGFENQTEGTNGGQVVTVDGKQMSLGELVRKLLAGEDAEDDTGKSVLDLLRQMIAQAQNAGNIGTAALLQDALQNARSADSTKGMAIQQENGNTVLHLMAKSDDGMQKIVFHANENSPLKFSTTAKQDSLQPEATAAADIQDTSAAGISPGKNTATVGRITLTPAGNAAAESTITPAVVQPVKGGEIQETRTSVYLQNGPEKAGSKVIPATATATDAFRPGTDMAAIQAASPKGEDVSAEAVEEMGEAKTAGVSASAEVKVAAGPAGKAPAGAPDNPLAPAVQNPQTPYGKDGISVKEAVQVNRLSEVSEPIMKSLGEGTKHILIKIEPPDLGSIQIRLKVDNGVLRADFKVDSPAVKDLFSAAIPQIKSSIEDRGIKAGEFFVDLKDGSYSDGREQREHNQGQQSRQQKESKFNFFDFFA